MSGFCHTLRLRAAGQYNAVMLGSSHQQGQRGFTIVELLIVVVVIAILAAISIVAYSGIQRRANNAAIVDAAAKSLRAVQAYIAANGSYPIATTNDFCITTETGCGSGIISTTFETNMATISTLPRSVPEVSPSERGLWFTYNANQTLNGSSRPMRLTYYLTGTNQRCGAGDVVQYTWPDFIYSTTGNTGNTVNGNTRCWISVPGPGV